MPLEAVGSPSMPLTRLGRPDENGVLRIAPARNTAHRAQRFSLCPFAPQRTSAHDPKGRSGVDCKLASRAPHCVNPVASLIVHLWLAVSYATLGGGLGTACATEYVAYS